MSTFLRNSILGVFVVIRIRFIVSFIVVFNLLALIGFLLNGGIGDISNTKAAIAFCLMFGFTGYCGLAPLVSEKIRDRWCDPRSDFEDARFGLMLLGTTGVLLALFGIGIFFQKLMQGGFTEEISKTWFGENILFYLILFFVLAMFLFSVHKNKRRLRE